VKLYTMMGSRYASRCLIQMSAKGIEIPVEVIPYPVPESFRAINPLMMVPVLDIDGELLPEAQVICEYLEDLGSGPSLRPEDPRLRARMRLLIRLFELYYDPAALKLYRFVAPGVNREDEILARAFADMEKFLSLIAAHLDGGKYAVGAQLSLADCALMPPFCQAKIICPILKLGDPIAANETISAYYDATRKDPHVARVLDQIETSIKRALKVDSPA
jgi:glutathione S-transferase